MANTSNRTHSFFHWIHHQQENFFTAVVSGSKLLTGIVMVIADCIHFKNKLEEEELQKTLRLLHFPPISSLTKGITDDDYSELLRESNGKGDQSNKDNVQ